MVFIQTEFLRDILADSLPVTGQHYSPAHTKFLQTSDCLGTIILNHITYDDMTCVFAVHCHMHNRAHKMTVMPPDTEVIHHFRIAHTDSPPGNLGPDTAAGNLLHIRNFASISSFLRESTTQSRTYRMSRKMFHMSSQMKQFPLIEIRRMNRLDLELAIGQCPCLIEHDHTEPGQCIHKIAALNQHSPLRCGTKSAEK